MHALSYCFYDCSLLKLHSLSKVWPHACVELDEHNDTHAADAW